MGYLRLNEVRRKKNPAIVRVKLAMQKLQRRLLLSLFRWEFEDDDRSDDVGMVGDEMVVEGHFPVFTTGGESPKKFFVGLSYLKHPAFVKLLKEMEREFGFDQQGVLVVPCQASELQRILSWI
ncbi:Auxin-induced protein [Macleaya cordata]|uniref:Auxin-induced protein n=1 Tax=Macleaya cordata TaxID=56857 RepID=A0A200Q961_MACCD|nr:Auxin-induced protein [Macleaya cordata]